MTYRFLLLLILHFTLNNTFSQCTHYLIITDTYGDAWNGGTVGVSVNGTNVLTGIALASGHGPEVYTFSASAGQTIRVYESAAGSFPAEMRVSIYSPNHAALIYDIDPVAGNSGSGGTTSTAACPAGVISPGGVSAGLTLWMDPNVSFSPASWTSKSQSASVYSQATVNLQPSSQSSTLNFNNSIRFLNGGTQDKMISAAAPVINNDPTFESFFALKDFGTAGWSTVFGFSESAFSRYDISPGGNTLQLTDINSTGDDVAGTLPYSGTIPFFGNSFVNYKRAENFLNGGYNSFISVGNYYCYKPEATSGICSRNNPQIDLGEIIIYDRVLISSERSKVNSYLAVKYGITLGVNGTSLNYMNAAGNIIKTQANGYNYDIVGIGRDDVSQLNQLKSRSVNLTTGQTFGGQRRDIITLANGNNFSSPGAIGVNQSFLLIGNDNGALNNGNVIQNITTDNGENIQSKLIRVWRAEETGTIGQITIECDMSNPAVGWVGNNDLANLRLLIDEDGNFSTGATSLTPTSYNNTTDLAYFTIDFTTPTGNPLDQLKGYYFTVASTNIATTPLPVQLVSFLGNCSEKGNLIQWTTESELNNDYFILERSYDLKSWEAIENIDGTGNSSQVNNYSVLDKKSNNEIAYYKLTQVDYNGSKNSSSIISIDRKECVLETKIFPNPTKDSFTIFNPMIIDDYVQIFDYMGRLVLSLPLSKELTIDTKNWSKGIYFIKLSGNTHKLVVQ
ncbi:MAG: T9SS type A sorting domain-containing protein [Flavobacteriales bacterium]|nr:T9SS type A sorting domain-containing protein [Flavobacteriales bacterium]